VLAFLAILWIAPLVIEAIGGIDIAGVERPYALIGLFVWWDAVFPLLPSESLLNTASTLIAAGDSELDLGVLIAVGALGAILGDSTLYWIARTAGRRLVARPMDQAKRNEKAMAALEVLTQSAPLVIVGGRFVPGLRFVVNATMGLERYPYLRFLFWSTIGGAAWASFTCALSYLVGTELGEYPLFSLVISALVTTALLALLYVRLKRRYVQVRTEPGQIRG
jgi:membrane-associated protein